MKQLDNDMGGAVNDMAMMLGVVQMRMQQRTYASVEKIADAMESSKANGGGGSSDAEAMAQAVAQAAGMSREEASQELGDLKDVSCASLVVSLVIRIIWTVYKRASTNAFYCKRLLQSSTSQVILESLNELKEGQDNIMSGQQEMMDMLKVVMTQTQVR